MTIVNFAEASEGFDPLPEGIYNATVFKCEHKVGKESQKPYLAWTFAIQDPGHKNRRLFHNTSLQPQALRRFRDVLLAVGYTKEQLSGQLSLGQEFFDAISGRPVRLNVTIDEEGYQGQPRNRVARVMPVDPLAGESPTPPATPTTPPTPPPGELFNK